jgi:hypothetical protein
VDRLEYWDSGFDPSGDPHAEGPPTQYGRTNAEEDLAESVAIYFLNKPKLEADCPKRAAFITALIASWTPPVKEKALATAATAKGGGH